MNICKGKFSGGREPFPYSVGKLSPAKSRTRIRNYLGMIADLDKLQAALDEMNEDGTAAKISEKWFGEDKVLK